MLTTQFTEIATDSRQFQSYQHLFRYATTLQLPATGWFGVAVMAFVTSKLRRARLVLGLVTIFGGSTIHISSPLSLSIPPWQVQRVPKMVSAISGKKRRLGSYDLIALYKPVYIYQYIEKQCTRMRPRLSYRILLL